MDLRLREQVRRSSLVYHEFPVYGADWNKKGTWDPQRVAWALPKEVHCSTRQVEKSERPFDEQPHFLNVSLPLG